MKINVMKGYTDTQYQDVAVDISGTCSLCMPLFSGSPKEQMKMKVVGLYTCTINADIASDKPGKYCMYGMGLTTAKSK